MYGIISNNPERQAEIKRIVKDKGNIIYENITENIALALKEIGRVNVQTVVIDVNDVFEDDFIAGIKNFKVARPAARIILITPGRTPGDKILSQAVAKGIYDIVSDISGLEEAVENKASYADAVRWDVESVRQGKEEEKEPQYIERVVSRVANLWFSIKKPEDNVWASQQEGRVSLPEVKTKLQKIISDISLKFAKTKKKTKGAAVIVVWNSSGQHMVSVALELAMIASGTLVNFNFDNPELDSWFGVKHHGEPFFSKTGILTLAEQLTKDMVVPLLREKKGIKFLPAGHKLGQIGKPEMPQHILKEIIEELSGKAEIVIISPCARYDAPSSIVAFEHADTIVIPFSCPQELEVAKTQLDELKKVGVITKVNITQCQLPEVDTSGIQAELTKVLPT